MTHSGVTSFRRAWLFWAMAMRCRVLEDPPEKTTCVSLSIQRRVVWTFAPKPVFQFSFWATPDDMSTPPLDVLTDTNATIFLRKV